MDIGLMIDSDYRAGQTHWQACDAVLATADQAETLGFDSLWLAERHFSPPGSAALVPSIGSAPLLLATAIAMRTSRIRLGTAVLLLPLGHPVRLAEEVATLDQLSQGRLHLGIGRSSFPRAYEGYGIPYAESRARFQEYLDIMRLAWTQPQFSYTGTFYTSHSAPFSAVLKQFCQSLRKRREDELDPDYFIYSNLLFPWHVPLITTSCKLGDPFLTLWGEPQRFGFPTRRATNDHPAPLFQGPEAMTDIALVSLQGAHEFLVTARDLPLGPLVVGGQPAQDTLLQL